MPAHQYRLSKTESAPECPPLDEPRSAIGSEREIIATLVELGLNREEAERGIANAHDQLTAEIHGDAPNAEVPAMAYGPNLAARLRTTPQSPEEIEARNRTLARMLANAGGISPLAAIPEMDLKKRLRGPDGDRDYYRMGEMPVERLALLDFCRVLVEQSRALLSDELDRLRENIGISETDWQNARIRAEAISTYIHELQTCITEGNGQMAEDAKAEYNRWVNLAVVRGYVAAEYIYRLQPDLEIPSKSIKDYWNLMNERGPQTIYIFIEEILRPALRYRHLYSGLEQAILFIRSERASLRDVLSTIFKSIGELRTVGHHEGTPITIAMDWENIFGGTVWREVAQQ